MFTFIFLVYLYNSCQGVISKYLYLMIIRIYFITIWTGLWYVMRWFLCIQCYLSCVPSCTMRAHCNPISIVFGNNRSMQSSSTPIVLLQPPYHHLWCTWHNFVHIMCAFYTNNQYRIQSTSIRPDHARFATGYILIYLILIAVHIILILPTLLSVELSI